MNNILEYLEKTAERFPEKAAVDDGKQSFSWSELVSGARELGSEFLKLTGRQKPVAILAEKSAQTLCAMFGVVYAGGFYVMIDPSQPVARVKEILRVLDPELVIVRENEKEILVQAGYENKIYILENDWKHEIDEEGLKSACELRKASDILYGIFTSGSTGTPKGIVVSHDAVIRFISHFVEEFGFTENDRMGNQAPFDFDVSVKDIYTSVMTGATLVLIPKTLFSTPPLLLDYICEKETTVLVWAVSALVLVSSLKGLKYRIPVSVRKILFSGEVMPLKQLRLWQAALPDTEFVNLYGPSEITCNCTFYRVPEVTQEMEKIPIGKAFSGRTVFLKNDDQKITEPGQVGEICVTGESLSDGYYNNAEETAKRFITWMEDGESSRCYCTGDLGYYDEDGNLFFSGRKDFQIKLMGHRIELEEVERAMDRIELLDRSCCLLDEKRNRLVAFYIGMVNQEDIKKQMKEYVPTYMIPQKFIKTEVMPLNKNGKTDRDYFRKQLGVKRA